MKKIYTHDNMFIVHNMKNILDNAGIETELRNEYAAGASGDLAPLDTWLELWLVHERDEAIATTTIKNTLSSTDTTVWTCTHCQESNESSFEICWQCQKEKATLP